MTLRPAKTFLLPSDVTGGQMDILDAIFDIGYDDAQSALDAGCDMGPCGNIAEEAIVAIRAILRRAGDARADLASLGYRAEGRDLMQAYASGWNSAAGIEA